MFRSYQDLVRTPKAEEASTTAPKVYNCDVCEKGGWLTANDIEIHKRHSHLTLMHEYRANHKDRFCTVCMTLLESNEELISHLKSQHLLSSPNAQRVERVIYICNECTHIFFNKDVLATHMLSVHLTKKSDRVYKRFTCPKCFKSYFLNSIWFHLQRHEIPSVSMCDICLSNFPSRIELFEHMKSHKSYYKCEPCGYTTSKHSQYEVHIQRHKQETLPFHRDVTQDVINRVFKRPRCKIIRYNVHNAIKGLILPKFLQICTLCREICVTQLEKKLHVIRDHMYDAIEKKKHFCACGEEFDYNIVLKQHVMKMKGSHRAVEDPSIVNKIIEKAINPLIRYPDSIRSMLKYKESEDSEDSLADYEQNEGGTEELMPPSELLLLKTEHDSRMELSNKIETDITNDSVLPEADKETGIIFATLTTAAVHQSETNTQSQ